MTVNINPKKLTILLVLIVCFLFILNIYSLMPMVILKSRWPMGSLNFDYENNVPTLFSTVLMWTSAILTFIIALSEKKNTMVFIEWLFVSLAFVVVGVDESISMHERFTEPLRNIVSSSTVFHFSWILPYAAVLLLFIIVYIPFFIKLPKSTKVHLLISAFLFILGAIGFEFIGGAWFKVHGKDITYYILASFEEMLEMFGAIGFIYTFMLYIDKYLKDFSLTIKSSATKTAA